MFPSVEEWELSCNSYHLVMVKHSLHFHPYSPFQTLSWSTKMDQWENSSDSYLVKSAPDVFTQFFFPWFREIFIPRSFQNRSCRETTNSFGIKFLPLGAVSYHFCLECPSCSIFLTVLTLHQSHLVFFTYFFYNNHPHLQFSFHCFFFFSFNTDLTITFSEDTAHHSHYILSPLNNACGHLIWIGH